MLHHALDRIAAMGPAGPFCYILLYAVCCVCFCPISPMAFGAGALWGVWPGIVFAWIGAAIGSCLSFLIGRHWLQAFVERKLARYPLFTAIDAAVSAQGARVVFLTRLTPIFPFNALNYGYGITRVKFREFMVATCLGMIPGTLMLVYLGAAAGAAMKTGTQARTRTPAEWAFFAVGLGATVAVVTLVGRAAKRALDEHTKPAA